MSNERVILCGDAESPTRRAGGKELIRLQLWGLDPNITLKIQAISEAFAVNISEVCTDLIEIATYVFCADQAITRGGETDPYMGENWRRQLNFHIPVRQPDIWKSKDIINCLTSTLNFLSDDFYNFQFSQLRHPPPFMRYLDGMGDSSFKPDEIVLFSGGLDSLAGAIQEAVIEKKQIILVSHRSAPKILHKQKELISGLNKYSKKNALHVPVRITKHNFNAREFTQRSRSFLYTALGATVAELANLPGLRMYENGIISMNLPISAQIIGTRATRSTHPRVLKGFSELFSLIFDRSFQIENPFIWETRAEVVKRISDAGCPDLIKESVSCSRVMEMSKAYTHCGQCSQCIDRRFAVLASGNDPYDPWEMYKMDLLIGDRQTLEDKTMLESYVKKAIEIDDMTDMGFFSHYSGETSRILTCLEGGFEENAEKLFDLHKRHAKEVCDVIDNAIKSNASKIRKGEVSNSSLLGIVILKNYTELTGTLQNELKQKDNIFKRKGDFWQIVFAGQEILLKDLKGLRYIHFLIQHPGEIFHILDLVHWVENPDNEYNKIYQGVVINQAFEEQLSVSTPAYFEKVVDAKALSEYKKAIKELNKEIEEALNNDNNFEALKLRESKEFLEGQILAVTGVRGRLRKFNDPAENIRKSVYNRINENIIKILTEHPELGQHLENSIKTGKFCSYTPEKPTPWEF